MGTVSVIPTEWKALREEIIFGCRLDWFETRAAKSEAGGGSGGGNGGGRGRGGRGRGRLGDGGGSEWTVEQKDTGGAASPAEAEALQTRGFDSIKDAKKSFLSDQSNRNRCWWACSDVGKKLGGCPFPDCKFSDTHPAAKSKKDKKKAKAYDG